MMFMGDTQYLGSFRVVLGQLLKVCEDRKSSIVVMMKILLLFHCSSMMALKGIPITVSDDSLARKVQELLEHLHIGNSDDSAKALIESATKADNVMKMGISWCPWL